MIDILFDKNVTIRKRHRCNGCGRVFDSGTKMHRQVCKYDDIYQVYSCLACKDIMDKFPELVVDEQEHWFPEGCVSEFIQEFYKGMTPEEVLSELIKAKQKR
jgi:hypothetical protein